MKGLNKFVAVSIAAMSFALSGCVLVDDGYYDDDYNHHHHEPPPPHHGPHHDPHHDPHHGNQIQNLFQVIPALVPNQSQDMDQGLFQVRELDQSLVLTAGLDTTDTDYQSFVNCNYYNEKGLHTLDL